MSPEQIAALAALAAQTGPDMTVAVSTGRTLPAGPCIARLCEYVELGNHAQEYEGKAKPAAPEFRLGFALYSANFCNEDGTPYVYRTFDMALSLTPKSKAFKLFKAMNWKNTATHFAQLIGSAVLLNFEQVTKDGKTRTNLNLDKTAPAIDPVSGGEYAIPALTPDLTGIFLFNHPTPETWAALHQEGSWEDGSSKNRVQEKIIKATNFAGSPLEAMLAGAGALPDPAAVAPVQAVQSVPVVAPVTAPSVAASAPVVAPVVAAPVVYEAPVAAPVVAQAPVVAAVPLAQPAPTAVLAPVVQAPVITTVAPITAPTA